MTSPSAHPDYYAVLGVACHATQAEIAAAFRRCARQWHPDVCPQRPDAAERFKAAVEAYAILGDPARRRAYDEQLRARAGSTVAAHLSGAAGYGFQARRRAWPGSVGDPWTIEWLDWLDVAPAAARAGSEWSSLASSYAPEWPPSELDIDAELLIAPSEARLGTTRRLAYRADELCATCCGQGATLEWYCPDCGGSGIARRVARWLDVRVPAGVRTGTMLVIAGAGHQSLGSGRRGALRLHVVVAPRPARRPARPW